MYQFLPEKTANYPVTLDIENTTAMPITGDKNQVVHEFDDESIAIMEIADNSWFDIELQWEYLSEADHDILFQLWNDTAQADGSRRTIYWKHPIKGIIYVIRLLTPLRIAYRPHLLQSIETMRARVEGAIFGKVLQDINLETIVDSETNIIYVMDG